MEKEELIKKRRNEILLAAYQVFAKKGYHSTNVADIAAELNIGHGTFYRYFENKLDVFTHVIDFVIQRIVETLASENPHLTHNIEDYREQCVRIGRSLFSLFIQDPHLSSLIFVEAIGISATIDQKLQNAFDLLGQFTQQYLENGLQKGFLRPGLNTRVTAFAINTMIFEGARNLLRAENRDAAVEEWIEAIISLMFDGVSK